MAFKVAPLESSLNATSNNLTGMTLSAGGLAAHTVYERQKNVETSCKRERPAADPEYSWDAGGVK